MHYDWNDSPESSAKLSYINYGFHISIMESPRDLSWVHYCLLFIYINDLNKATKYSDVHHLADDKPIVYCLTNH